MVSEEQKLSSRSITKRPNAIGDTQPARKRIRHTYAQRRRPSSLTPRDATITTPPRVVRTLGAMKHGSCSPTTGRVDFSTPMLKKIRDQPPTPLSNSSHFDYATKIPPAVLSDLQAIRRVIPNGHFRIYEAIFAWLSSLLQSTAIKKPDASPKSLLGMCLRRVPATLAEIEAWDRKVSEMEGNGSKWNVSNARQDLYEQFEGFGGSEAGWRPLKILVRADALLMLGTSVAEGLFEPSFVRLLAELCLHYKCNEEAASLVSSLGRQMAPPRSMSSTLAESATMQPLRAIVGGLRGKRSPGALFECLSHCLKAKNLPLAWLSTSGFRNVWTSSLETMTTNRLVPSMLEFMCAALERLVLSLEDGKRPGPDDMEQTVISMAAGMAATVMMLKHETTIERNQIRRRALRRITHALDRCSSEVQLQNQTGRDRGLFILALAHYLATDEIGSDHLACDERLEGVDEEFSSVRGDISHRQYRQALLLTCSIAQFRGRACGVPCHDILFEICDAMDKLTFPDWFRAGLRTDGAFVLAQKTKDLRDLAFAERLPTIAARTDRSRTVFSGWRWEEGISEWVLPSPARKLNHDQRGQGEKGQKARPDGQGKKEQQGRSSRWNRVNSDDEDNGDSDNDIDKDSDIDEDSDIEGTSPANNGERNSSRIQLSVSGRQEVSGWHQRINAARGLAVKELGAGEANSRASKGPAKAPSKGTGTGTVLATRRLRDVQGLSQIRKHGRLIGDDDWDELS